MFGSTTALRSPAQKSTRSNETQGLVSDVPTAPTQGDAGSSRAKDFATSVPTVFLDESPGSSTSRGSAPNKPNASIFNVPKEGRPRPEHHRYEYAPAIGGEKNRGEKLATTFQNPFAPRRGDPAHIKGDPGAVKIPAPSQPAPKPIQPQPPVMYSSMNLTTGGFQPANQFSTPGGLHEFEGWPGALQSKFGEPDPYRYVDPAQANSQIKALFEGAFGDEDEKPRTRRRKKELDQKADELANKLKDLGVQQKPDDRAEDGVDADDEDAEEDESVVEGLAVKLMPHQVVGVNWMKEKELGAKGKGSRSKGGILADDMGLGKTIQALALILSNPRPPLATSSETGRARISDSVGKNTLIIAPLALIKQWESEIKSKTNEDRKLRVLVHHGPKRTKRFEDLKKYDIIITTYQTLVSEHDGCSENVQYGCFGIHWYRLVLDEAHSIKNRNAKATKACRALRTQYRWCLTGTPVQNNLDELQSLIAFLKVDPYRELSIWKEQIVQPLSNGRGELAIRRLQAFLKAFMLRRTKKVLTAVEEDDEGGPAGEKKKQRNTFKLPARTVETVTCHLSPAERKFYDALEQKTDQRIEQLMRGTNMNYTSALTLLLRLRQACNHIELVKRAIDKDAATTGLSSQTSGVQTPRKGGDGDVDEMAALLGGLSVVTKQCEICLQDLSAKESSSGMIRCSDCQDNLNQQHMGMKKEKQERKSRKALAKKKARATRTRRAIVDSDDDDNEGEGDWVIPKDRRKGAGLGKAGGSEDENAECGGEWIGSDDSDTGNESSIVDLGSHKKHKDDSESLTSSDLSDSDDDSDEEFPSQSSSRSNKWPPSDLLASTKTKQLIQILQQESHEHKFIVFSQFTTMLDLIEPFLRAARLSFTRYDGSMRNDLREASLDRLRNQASTRVLLCSLKCGSLGLNLTAASRVVILEPFWNPFVEEQAIDRVHRLNQTRDVVVYRLTVAASVEERILELQARKRALAEAAIEGREVAKLSMKDILNLFKHGEEHHATGQVRPTQPWKSDEGSQKVTASTQASGFAGGAASSHLQPGNERKRLGASGRPADDPVYGRRW